MSLTRLIYISQRNHTLTDSDLEQIVRESVDRNESLGISGLLLVCGDAILQVLEGHALHVTTLYSKITQDPRHVHPRVLSQKVVEDRLFPDWGMNLATATRQRGLDMKRIEATLLKLRLSKENDPSADALALLQEFRTQLMTKAA